MVDAARRLSARQFGLAYAAALVTMLVLDAVFLGVVASRFYEREMGTLMAGTVRIVPATAFYLLFPLALVYLTLGSAPKGRGEAVFRGAVLGLAAYGAYDLTALAIIRDWPVGLSIVDMAWGGVMGAAAAASGYAVSWART